MSPGIGFLIALVALVLAIGVEGRGLKYNQTCSEPESNCDFYAGLTCDPETNRCRCEDNTKYDIADWACRRFHCFETCLQPGYECKNGRCQICWTSDNQYLCDHPERIYIPVAIAVAVTFAATISLWLLLMICCCCRRNFHAVTSYIVVQSQQYSRLQPHKTQTSGQNPANPKSTNPFASSWREDEQQQQQAVIREADQQSSATADVNAMNQEPASCSELPPAYSVAKAPPTSSAPANAPMPI